MSNANPYRAPAAEIADIPEDGEFELAGIGHRFGALVIDVAISAAIILPLAHATGTLDFVLDSEDSYGGAAEISALTFALFIVLQSYFLKKHGQTIGKKIVGIRMVDAEGKLPGLRRLLYRRYLPIFLYNAVPIIGGVLAVIDYLLVFRRDRRCLHDMLAGTRVVMAGAKHSSITWVIAPVFALIGLSIAISSIEPMLDAPPPKAHAHTGKTASTKQPAARKPAATKPPVKTASAQGTAGQTALAPATPGQSVIDPSAAKPAAHPSALTQAAAVAPAAPAPILSQAARKKLRHCATLGGAAAIIRCSQNVR